MQFEAEGEVFGFADLVVQGRAGKVILCQRRGRKSFS